LTATIGAGKNALYSSLKLKEKIKFVSLLKSNIFKCKGKHVFHITRFWAD